MIGGHGPSRLSWARRAVATAVSIAVTGCGSASSPPTGASAMRFTVSVTTHTFPASQSLSEHTHMVIAVRNLSSSTIPNIAATVCNDTCSSSAGPGAGTSAAAFASNISGAGIANPSRPIWIVDRPPGACGSSCLAGGPGSAVTAYSNTWALGPLAPGQTKVFDWAVTAVIPGRHRVAWIIAAGLDSGMRAETTDGSTPQGTFTVTIHSRPAQSYVSDSGKVVTTSH